MGEVSELADEHGLGPCAARRGGSSPPFPTFAEHRFLISPATNEARGSRAEKGITAGIV